MAKKKLTKAEREERDADYERVIANVRELAEKAQAKLDAQRSRDASESMTMTAVFTPDENGWTVSQLAEWPAVVTRARTVEEARELLLDAAREMVATYRDEGREPPIGGVHAEQVTIDIAAA